MSPSTTLITFRVRAPRSTQTLKLYGSWDNFTIPYPMNKDLQTGSEYWHGCFSFSNIICDGRPGEMMPARSGGLKMGGTYWYHYKIDDETDFHNVCERATGNCPLLPGQLVNVLHVPYALSGNRSRNPSTSSTSSERRTMNPEDKFMNPRPVPSKPDTLRVSTSPVLADFAQTKDDLHVPVKETPNGNRFLRLAKKGSVDSYSTSTSSTPLAGGLRAAFKLRTARSRSPDFDANETSSRGRRAVSIERPPAFNIDDKNDVISQRPERGLLLRGSSEDVVLALSFAQHRRRQSKSREPLGRILDSQNLPHQLENLTLLQSNYRPLKTLEEASPNENSRLDDCHADLAKMELDLEKRLPTLPNTPSSAYPKSMMENSPPRKGLLQFNLLDSHFSSTTIDTEPNFLSMAFNEQSHFSAWTTATTETSSLFINTSIPVPELYDQPEIFEDLFEPISQSWEDTYLSSSVSYESVCSSSSTTPSTSFLDIDAEFEAAQLAMGHPSQMPKYSLPENDYSSQITLKSRSQDTVRGRSGNPSIVALAQDTEAGPHPDEIIHSESMRRLLEELSYLSEMIQH